MIECPKCLQITNYRRRCEKCGEIIIETAEDKFNNAADIMSGLLKTELNKRKKRKRMRYITGSVICGLVLIMIIYIGYNFIKLK